MVLWAIRIGIAGVAVLLWWRGEASPGDVTYILTTYFVLHGYLRDIGMHVSNLQRSVNELEELVDLHDERPEISTCPARRPSRRGRARSASTPCASTTAGTPRRSTTDFR